MDDENKENEEQGVTMDDAPLTDEDDNIIKDTKTEKKPMDDIIIDPTIEELRGLSEKHGLNLDSPFLMAIARLKI